MDDNTRSAARHGEVPARSASGVPRSAVVGVVLAAGASRRFGENKLLAPFRGKPLLRWVIEDSSGHLVDKDLSQPLDKEARHPP